MIVDKPWGKVVTYALNQPSSVRVITVEPGLYYPEKGMGFRIEDTYWVRPDGKMEILADYPYDFVLEMKRWKK